MTDYHTPRFSGAQTAKAAGITPESFRSHFKRGNFRMLGKTDEKAATHGVPNKFSLRDVMGFAVAQALIEQGAKAKPAWEVAMINFAHSSVGERNPAQLFNIHELGETYLSFWEDKGSGHGYIFAAGFDLKSTDIFGPYGHMRSGVILLYLNPIEQQVMHRLGIAG